MIYTNVLLGKTLSKLWSYLKGKCKARIKVQEVKSISIIKRRNHIKDFKL